MSSRLNTYSRKRTIRTILVIVAILLFTGLFSMGFMLFLTIKNVIVDAPGMDIHIDTKSFAGNLLFLPADTLRNDLLDRYPMLSDVTFEKKFPNTIVIHMTKRPEFAWIQTKGSSYALDEHGVVLGSSDSPYNNRVLIFDVDPVSIGTTIADARVLTALKFLQHLDQETVITSISEHDRESLIATFEHTTILLPNFGKADVKARTLQTILEGLKIKGTLPRVVDLRFDKPIISN